MSDTAHNLSNSFLAVRLLALHEFPPAAGLGGGPFLVVQHAVAPDDPELEPRDFLLTRRGTWLPVEDYFRLRPDRRGERACFPSAAEVIALLEHLPSRPTVERREGTEGGGGDPAAGDPPWDDAFDAGLLRAIRGDDPKTSGGPWGPARP